MTPAAQHPHCDHECVCRGVQVASNFHCPLDSGYWKSCEHDTRASHPAQQQRKPCYTCRIPKQNKNGSCCLDSSSCVDIEKWEREHILIKKVLALMEAFKKETIEDGNDFYDGYIDEAIALLQAEVPK